MLIVFTGNGKGKTTAALGQALRLVGQGKKVLMIQFIKGPWISGEDRSAKFLAPNFELIKMGKGFVGIMGDSLPRKEHVRAAKEALLYAKKEAQSKKWNTLILDELNNAVDLDLVGVEEVLQVLKEVEACVEHIIITGRNAPKEFIERADLVTKMLDLKHPYNKGQKGRRGVEY